jgi:hypothetical protein
MEVLLVGSLKGSFVSCHVSSGMMQCFILLSLTNHSGPKIWSLSSPLNVSSEKYCAPKKGNLYSLVSTIPVGWSSVVVPLRSIDWRGHLPCNLAV